MKKKVLFLLLSLFVCSLLFAQTDERIVGAHKVKISVNSDVSFGYEIYSSETLVTKQLYKPFIMLAKGFKIKENAFIVAEWHVKQIETTGNKKLSMTIDKARELGVSEEDLSSN